MYCTRIFWQPLRFWNRALLHRDAFAPAVEPCCCPVVWCASFSQICSHKHLDTGHAYLQNVHHPTLPSVALCLLGCKYTEAGPFAATKAQR